MSHLLVIMFIIAASLPAIVARTPLAAERQASPKFQEWQIIETITSQQLSFEEFALRLAAAEIVYIGEEHHNGSHIEAAVKLLEMLQQQKRRPVLGLEMFSWDAQAILDRYVFESTLPKEQFLKDAHWQQNWGGIYEEYEPLIDFARRHRLRVIALNPPRSLVRKVAKQGIASAMSDAEMSRWGMQDDILVEDPQYRDTILKQLRACHTGLADDAYQRMYEASVFRDEGMAKTISDALGGLAEGAGPILSYTGAGHIQYRLPIPNRVSRRQPTPVRQITVYLAAFDPGRVPEIQELLEPPIADYLWLTPLGQHGPSRRCI
jgi:uncharacterized iron-regulated protein